MDLLRSLRLFIRVADHRSFSLAAEEAGIEQSTVSRSLAALEDTWGVALLHRSTRQVSLTAAGELAYGKAQTLIAAADRLGNAMTGEDPERAGLLRIHASVAFARFVLTPLLPRFVAVNPRVHLDFVANDRPIDLVAGAIDLAFVAGRPKDSTLTTRKIGQFQRILAASPEFVRRYGNPSSPDDLTDVPCVVTTLTQNPARWELKSSHRNVALEVSGPLLANSGGIVREAMLQGLGVGLVPTFLVLEDFRRSSLVRILPDWRGFNFDVHAVWPSHRHLPEKARAFMGMVGESLADTAVAFDRELAQ